jgi:hypothetical protein
MLPPGRRQGLFGQKITGMACTGKDDVMRVDTDTAIERVALALLARTLPRADWTHEAHFAAALWLLRHHPALATPDAMRGLISAYNISVGTVNDDHGGYHHSITIASLQAAAAALAAHPADTPLADVLAGLMAGPHGRSGWLLAHWSRDRLFSVAARRDWLAPDLAPLPF